MNNIEADEIVELFEKEDGKWYKTVMHQAEFICDAYNENKDECIRRIEGSLDGGMTWKTIYNREAQLLGLPVWNTIKWRVKEK